MIMSKAKETFNKLNYTHNVGKVKWLKKEITLITYSNFEKDIIIHFFVEDKKVAISHSGANGVTLDFAELNALYAQMKELGDN